MNKKTNTIPMEFKNEKEAGEFWDKHSAADFMNDMYEVEIDFEIKKKVYLVPLEEKLYQRARNIAKTRHSTVKRIVNNLLNRDLLHSVRI